MRYVLSLIFCFQSAFASNETFLGTREEDPASLVENVSVIHGEYSEVEVDLTVPAPDTLVLSRFYSSRDATQTATLGGWHLNPHCFLSLQKDPQERTYTTEEGTFEYTYVLVGTPEGSILPYTAWYNPKDSENRVLFKIDTDGETPGLANTARGDISAWTNQKNNELYFDPQGSSFELVLSSGGRRFYTKHSSSGFYLLKSEVLPSGNKISYKFDDQGQLTLIEETNASEQKVLGWIKIRYESGMHVDTSDGQTVDYHFQQDPSGQTLLSGVVRSDKPSLSYEYKIVNGQVLLKKKQSPEGRCVSIDYDPNQNNTVKSVTIPTRPNEAAVTQFSYGQDPDGTGWTEVNGPGTRKALYRFDGAFQLTSIAQYLEGQVYRVYKKFWGKRNNATNLMAISIEDGHGEAFYYKSFVYDDRDTGNVVEEREYGNLTGANPGAIAFDEEGLPSPAQESHTKTFSYFTVGDVDVVAQENVKGKGVQLEYKRGTHLLIKKTLGEKEIEKHWLYGNSSEERKIRKRWFYDYNDDGVLIRVTVDDGKDSDPENLSGVTERHITVISPKQELPNIGTAEVIEEKCLSAEGKSEVLLKKTVNHFDSQGNLSLQDVYDADGVHRYSMKTAYEHGLLTLETDPLGNETRYSYDANQNLQLQRNLASGISIEYGYDLKNRLISTVEKDSNGKSFITRIFYNLAGDKISETDRFDQETIYEPDALGRTRSVTYPKIREGALQLIYTYGYDLFDNVTTIKDPEGNITKKTYTVRENPAFILYPNGTKERFKYDSEGSLRYHTGKNGLTAIFEYDYLGRVAHVECFERDNEKGKDSFKRDSYHYNAFHLLSKSTREMDTLYGYDFAGRLSSVTEARDKSRCWYGADGSGISKIEDGDTVEFLYDPLGRTRAVKKWKDSKTFTLYVKEYDLLDRIEEERTEDAKGNILAKSNYVYHREGPLFQVIGYPQNQKSILAQYDYDHFGRLCTIRDAFNQETKTTYEDAYINEVGQKVLKRIQTDPLGNQQEEIFDPLNNLVKVLKKDKTGQLLAETEFIYDSLGHQTFENTAVISFGKALKTYKTGQTYEFGDQLKTIARAVNTPNERTTTFSYNSYGEPSQRLNPGVENPITYEYDDRGQRKSISYKNAEASTISHRLSYDDRGHLSEVTLDSGPTLQYKIDTNKQLLSETVKDPWGSYQVSCTYDGEGLIETVTLPDASRIEYTYEGPFVKSVSHVTKGQKKLYTYKVAARDLMGHLLKETLIGCVGERKQIWDTAARRTEIVTDFFQDRVPEGAYDPLHNIKKREIALNKEKTIVQYGYNALSQLSSEKRGIDSSYDYDSLGNRLQRDDFIYKVDDLNQLLEAEGITYTFDGNGNLETKTLGEETWIYQSDALGHLISIQDPNENTVIFTYDLSGKRLTKQVEAAGKKTKIFRYFYLGQTELGCLDEKGNIIELKVPSDPNRPETAPCVALEIKKEIYAPLYDLQGNIACLIDPQKRKIVESYRYSAFGEEEIFNEKGLAIADSSIGNPWRYQGKRVDKETGLIYFGQRYYDPKTGRWLSPDPAGEIDGPNLYAFVLNNPVTYVDPFGLTSELNEDWAACVCGYCVRGEFCHCLGSDPTNNIDNCNCRGILCHHKMTGGVVPAGSKVASALGGISHGCVDFLVGSLHGLETAAVHLVLAEKNLQERALMIEVVERSQESQMAAVDSWMMDLMSVDASDVVYQSFRSGTTMTLDAASLVAGGYGLVKGAVALPRLLKMPAEVAKIVKLSTNPLKSGEGFFGSKGFELKNAKYQRARNTPTSIQGRSYGGHALDQMQNRGFTPSVVEGAIQNNLGVPNKVAGRVQFYDPMNNISVVTENGEVVTVVYGRLN